MTCRGREWLQNAVGILERLTNALVLVIMWVSLSAVLLCAWLRCQQMERAKGRVAMGGRLAYVAQQAWILNDTLINNVLFGQPFDEDRWNTVVKVCWMLEAKFSGIAGASAIAGRCHATTSGGAYLSACVHTSAS